MKKKSKSVSVHFRAKPLDQDRLAVLRKTYKTNNAGAIREALRIAAETINGGF